MDQEHDRDVEIKLLRERNRQLETALAARMEDLKNALNRNGAMAETILELRRQLNAR